MRVELPWHEQRFHTLAGDNSFNLRDGLVKQNADSRCLGIFKAEMVQACYRQSQNSSRFGKFLRAKIDQPLARVFL